MTRNDYRTCACFHSWFEIVCSSNKQMRVMMKGSHAMNALETDEAPSECIKRTPVKCQETAQVHRCLEGVRDGVGRKRASPWG